MPLSFSGWNDEDLLIINSKTYSDLIPHYTHPIILSPVPSPSSSIIHSSFPYSTYPIILSSIPLPYTSLHPLIVPLLYTHPLLHSVTLLIPSSSHLFPFPTHLILIPFPYSPSSILYSTHLIILIYSLSLVVSSSFQPPFIPSSISVNYSSNPLIHSLTWLISSSPSIYSAIRIHSHTPFMPSSSCHTSLHSSL